MYQQQTVLEKIPGKGEIACNEQLLLNWKSLKMAYKVNQSLKVTAHMTIALSYREPCLTNTCNAKQFCSIIDICLQQNVHLSQFPLKVQPNSTTGKWHCDKQ